MATIGARVFRCARFGWRTFCFLMGDVMSTKSQKNVLDVTGIELTPGEPAVCLGNGEQGFECCCDECDYYLLCFPRFKPENKSDNFEKKKDRSE